MASHPRRRHSSYSGVSWEELKETAVHLRVISVKPRFKPGTSKVQERRVTAEPVPYFHVLKRYCNDVWGCRDMFSIMLTSALGSES
jgi:hypothetical protein